MFSFISSHSTASPDGCVIISLASSSLGWVSCQLELLESRWLSRCCDWRTACSTDESFSYSWQEQQVSSSLQPPELLWKQSNLLFNSFWAIFPRLKQPEREIATHLHPFMRLRIREVIQAIELSTGTFFSLPDGCCRKIKNIGKVERLVRGHVNLPWDFCL